MVSAQKGSKNSKKKTAEEVHYPLSAALYGLAIGGVGIEEDFYKRRGWLEDSLSLTKDGLESAGRVRGGVDKRRLWKEDGLVIGGVGKMWCWQEYRLQSTGLARGRIDKSFTDCGRPGESSEMVDRNKSEVSRLSFLKHTF